MSQLRSFAFYGNVAPIVITPESHNLVNLDGYVAATGWFQLFDLAAAPAAAAVPLKSIFVPGAGMLSSLLSSLGPIKFNNGIVAAMSSTEATYTAVATSFDVWGEYEEYEYDETLGATIVGDTVTPINKLQVWVETNPATKEEYRLTKLSITEGNGVASLVVISANVDETQPDIVFPIAASATVVFHFGVNGYHPLVRNKAGVLLGSCTVAIASSITYASTDTAPLPAPTVNLVAANCNIKAWYYKTAAFAP